MAWAFQTQSTCEQYVAKNGQHEKSEILFATYNAIELTHVRWRLYLYGRKKTWNGWAVLQSCAHWYMQKPETPVEFDIVMEYEIS